jgi:hypothetical protein
MKLIVTVSITTAMVVHAVLGCCAHHEHQAVTLHDGLNVQHACHAHHEHQGESEEGPSVPVDCDEENCVFVTSKHNSYHTVDWAGFCILATVMPLQDHGFQQAAFTRIVPEDAPSPAGPARHVWQCVWVI